MSIGVDGKGLGCAYPTGGCEGAVNIEEADGVLEGTVLEWGVCGGHLDGGLRG
jgi:hypothetical protein